MTDDELLALARKATPGPYHVGDERLPVLTAMGVLPHRHIALLESVREPDFKANADYLKALAPENIIALIERHRAEVEAERKLAEDWQRLHGIVTRRAEAAEAALAAAQKRVGLLQGTVAFFASVIKSGEPWTQTCEDALRAALAGGTAGDGEQVTQQQRSEP